MSAPARFTHSPEVLARARAVEWVRFNEGDRQVSVRFGASGPPLCLTCLKNDCRHVIEAKRERAKGKGEHLPEQVRRACSPCGAPGVKVSRPSQGERRPPTPTAKTLGR